MPDRRADSSATVCNSTEQGTRPLSSTEQTPAGQGLTSVPMRRSPIWEEVRAQTKPEETARSREQLASASRETALAFTGPMPVRNTETRQAPRRPITQGTPPTRALSSIRIARLTASCSHRVAVKTPTRFKSPAAPRATTGSAAHPDAHPSARKHPVSRAIRRNSSAFVWPWARRFRYMARAQRGKY